MNSDRFTSLVNEAFPHFLAEFGFKSERPHLSGRYYRINFVGQLFTLVFSFEPGDNYFTVMLVRNNDNDLSAIDDPQRTLRLSDLNRMYMPDVTDLEREANEAFFSSVIVNDKNERALMKCAKDLRLVLPRHLHKMQR